MLYMHVGVMPQALLERLRQPLFLSSLLYDELLSVLLCMAWGTFWDAPLWAALVRRLNELVCSRMLTYAGVRWRMLVYADGMLKYADVC
jgi:hypothetical protein